MKKLISLILASVLVLGSLVGCATDEDDNNDTAVQEKPVVYTEVSLTDLEDYISALEPSDTAYNIKVVTSENDFLPSLYLGVALNNANTGVLLSLNLEDCDFDIGSSLNHNTAIYKVILPKTLDTLKQLLLSGCVNLEEISIPSTVTSIGESAFRGCTNLKQISIPSSVKEIGAGAFHSCTNLEQISIPASVISIGENAFRNCTNLEQISIPSSVKEIGASAFYSCTNLEQISIPSSVKEIGASAFYSCTNLKKIDLPDSLETIETTAFSNCTNLKEIEIPASVTAINPASFRSCSNLLKVTFKNPEGWQRKKYTRSSSTYIESEEPAEVISNDKLSDPLKAAELLKEISTLTDSPTPAYFKWTRT